MTDKTHTHIVGATGKGKAPSRAAMKLIHEHSASHSSTIGSSSAWCISPSAPALDQLRPVLERLKEELNHWNPTLTAEERQAIKKHIRRLLAVCLRA